MLSCGAFFAEQKSTGSESGHTGGIISALWSDSSTADTAAFAALGLSRGSRHAQATSACLVTHRQTDDSISPFLVERCQRCYEFFVAVQNLSSSHSFDTLTGCAARTLNE
jgi:hypothetical protein